MDRGRRREPQGKMSSCLANERQPVEAPSTLLTSSFVLHNSHHMRHIFFSLGYIISLLKIIGQEAMLI